MSKIIYAKTHADFLNQAFCTNYKAYYKGRWPYDNDTWVWMVRMDNKIRDGWINRIINENEIHEEYVWNDIPSYSNDRERAYRIAVNIIDTPYGREYHILGKYKYDFVNSTNVKHILIKIK